MGGLKKLRKNWPHFHEKFPYMSNLTSDNSYCCDSEIPEYFSILMGIIGEAGALRIKKNDTYPD
jgi:hypothetical protein